MKSNGKSKKHRTMMLFPLGYANEGAIIIAASEPQIDQTLKTINVKQNSHAEQIVMRAWNSIFRGLIDLNQIFLQYYYLDYIDFIDFIEKSYGCNATLMKIIKEAQSESLFIGFVRYKSNRFTDLIFGETRHAEDEPPPFSRLFNICIDYSAHENQI